MSIPVLYYDYISPYSYLIWEILKKRNLLNSFEFRPLVLGKIFNKIGQVPIANITPKRDYLFKKALRVAKANDIVLRAPKAHPFNSLYALRLSTIHCSKDLTERLALMDCLWRNIWNIGIDAGNPDELLEALDNDEFDSSQFFEKSFEKPARLEISKNIDNALRSQVFGVPSIVEKEEVFWGVDALEDYMDFKAGNDSLDYNIYNNIKMRIDSHD